MDLERFTTLCETYGGRIARWPAPEQAGAHAMAKSDQHAAALLAQADRLDAMLDQWAVGPADVKLREAVLASAGSSSRIRHRSAPWTRDVRLWFAGAGLAAGLAGVFCGAVLSTVAVGEARDEALVASAVSDAAVSVPGAAQT